MHGGAREVCAAFAMAQQIDCYGLRTWTLPLLLHLGMMPTSAEAVNSVESVTIAMSVWSDIVSA